jgi:uncharacterized membrane protein YcaP (DUF421 family)
MEAAQVLIQSLLSAYESTLAERPWLPYDGADSCMICKIDWNKIFLPDTPLLEIFIRGTIMYLCIYFLLRFVLKRQAGSIGVADILVLVLISDAAQNAMAAEYHSIPDGLLLVSTIIFWSYTLDWLGYRFPRFERVLHPPPLRLVKDGRMLRRNMRRELITEQELMSQLRQEGISDLKNVKEACMEGDGRISIIRHDQDHKQ